MLLQELVVLPLLIQSVKGWGERPRSNHNKKPVIPELPDVCTANYTVTDTTTVQVTRYVDYTVNLTTTQIITECTTTTLHYTTAITKTDTDSVTITDTDTALVTITNTGTDSVTITTTDTDSVTITNTETDLTTITNTGTDSVTITTTDTDSVTITNTETDLTTITNTGTDSVTVTTTETDSKTVTNTETDSTTVTNTETDSVTITNTETDSVTITNTDTTTTTTTVFSTTYDPCPKSCTISAETVNLYFWPTNRPYTYPTTYYHSSLDYTFTSPSVYMLIPTAVGINTANQTAGPQTTSWILPLNIWEVSTIDGLPQQPQTPGAGYGGGVPSGGVTRQITLADLGTDCPQTADPTAIATMLPEPRCNPVLAAPSQVRSWAYPCNACGKFGLFDPPYAVPTVTGGLFPEPETSTTVVTIPPPVIVTATHVPVETSPPPAPVASGTVVVEYYNTDGGFLSSSILPTTGVTGTVTRSVTVFGPSTTAEVPGVSSTAEGGITTGPIETTSEPGSVPTGGVTTSSVATASARRWVGEIAEGRNKWFVWVAGVAFVMFWL